MISSALTGKIQTHIDLVLLMVNKSNSSILFGRPLLNYQSLVTPCNLVDHLCTGSVSSCTCTTRWRRGCQYGTRPPCTAANPVPASARTAARSRSNSAAWMEWWCKTRLDQSREATQAGDQSETARETDDQPE